MADVSIKLVFTMYKKITPPSIKTDQLFYLVPHPDVGLRRYREISITDGYRHFTEHKIKSSGLLK